jgi:hypothetical protein
MNELSPLKAPAVVCPWWCRVPAEEHHIDEEWDAPGGRAHHMSAPHATVTVSDVARADGILTDLDASDSGRPSCSTCKT